MIRIASVTSLRLIVKCIGKQQASDEQLNIGVFKREAVEGKWSGSKCLHGEQCLRAKKEMGRQE